jgi:signal transduction histidine kinase
MFSLYVKCCWLLLFCSAILWGEHRQGSNRQDAIDYVNKAVAFAKKYGNDSLLSAINQANNEFYQNEMYVFVYDTNGTVIAHPVNKKIVGKNLLDIPDVDGKYFRRDIVEMGKKQDTAWIDYKYKNPENGYIEHKTTFIYRVGRIIIGCGIYGK